MSIKPRSPGQTAISISLPESLVAQVEERAQALGLSRSQYLVQPGIVLRFNQQTGEAHWAYTDERDSIWQPIKSRTTGYEILESDGNKRNP